MSTSSTPTTADRRDAGPVALVAGGSRGLGLLIARELHRHGYTPVICARSDTELQDASDQLAREGIRVHTGVMDVGEPGQVEQVTARIEREMGPVEVLICVAGVIQVGPLTAMDRDDFVRAIDVMLWGPINTALAVLPAMRRRGHGRIGIISSVGGLIAAPHLLPYSTAKHGAVGFGRGLRSELAGTGISVTTVTPGLMRTGSHVRAWFRGDVRQEYAWFSTAATLPVLSMDARRAARRIVSGVLTGRPVVILTPLAQLAPRIDALAPRLGSAVLSLTARLLPTWPADSDARPMVEGWQVEEDLARRPRAVLRTLTILGRRAAARTNERPRRPVKR